MDKQQELQAWKDHLREILPEISEQLEWLRVGDVVPTISESCPEKLKDVAERLVAIQSEHGEYQRNQISKQDIEKIKYYSKTEHLSFEQVIQTAVDNSRYLSKTAIEARGVVGFITEIKSVYDKYYQKNGVFPINAMNAEVKRACRNFKTDVSVKDKVEAIIDVFFPEMKGINIVERDNSLVQPSRAELSTKELTDLIKYFSRVAQDGKIDACFSAFNQDEFLQKCKILDKAGISLSEFLDRYTGLTYSRCYTVQPVPAVAHMLRAHMQRCGTTRNITKVDPYLRHKIEVVQKITGKYSMLDLINFLHVNGDNTGEGRLQLSDSEIATRRIGLVKRLEYFYPDKSIEEEFIQNHPNDYEELKLIASRSGFSNMDAFLQSYGFTRKRAHVRKIDNSIYLSENDLQYYHFQTMTPAKAVELDMQELNPADYIGVYNKLIAQGLDSSQFVENKTLFYGE